MGQRLAERDDGGDVVALLFVIENGVDGRGKIRFY